MKIDIAKARARTGSRSSKPFDEPCQSKTRRRLGHAAGLTQFGVNLLELGPDAWSSQRHWHAHEDEFVFMLRVSGIRPSKTASCWKITSCPAISKLRLLPSSTTTTTTDTTKASTISPRRRLLRARLDYLGRTTKDQTTDHCQPSRAAPPAGR